MSYTINKVDVWAADIRNRPGMLARVLEALTNAGANLEFLISRRVTENTSRVFLAPLKGRKQQQAAAAVGVVRAKGMHSFRVEGPDKRGLGASLARAVADQGVNVRGCSAAAIGRKSVTHLAFSTESDMKAAMGIVRKALRNPGRP